MKRICQLKLTVPARQKCSAKDRTTADRKMSLKRPAVGGESCKQDSFLYNIIVYYSVILNEEPLHIQVNLFYIQQYILLV